MRRVLILVLFTGFLFAAEPRKTRNIVLVTADGLRWQEVFGGVDPAIPAKNPVPAAKREAILPFFWKELAPKGVVLRARVTNSFRVSYPGYSEILTGRAQDESIRGNDPIQNPAPTVLEFVRQRLNLASAKAALFGSWATFRHIGEHTPGAITINAGYQNFDAPGATARLKALSALQYEVLTPFPEVRHDYITYEMALEYMRRERPRILYLALGETDDWAHERRYDLYVKTATYFDACLRGIWNAVDRDSTTLIVTSDHGRGGTAEDWNSHGREVPGADRIWIAIIGPDTPEAGEITAEAEQRDIAPTILSLLGLDYHEYSGATGKPIAAAFRK